MVPILCFQTIVFSEQCSQNNYHARTKWRTECQAESRTECRAECRTELLLRNELILRDNDVAQLVNCDNKHFNYHVWLIIPVILFVALEIPERVRLPGFCSTSFA